MMECRCTIGLLKHYKNASRIALQKRSSFAPMHPSVATPVKSKKTARTARGMATNDLVFSASTGTNDEVFPTVLKLYVPPDSKIADVTFGQGVFWKKVEKGVYKVTPSDLSMGTDCRAGVPKPE